VQLEPSFELNANAYIGQGHGQGQGLTSLVSSAYPVRFFIGTLSSVSITVLLLFL